MLFRPCLLCEGGDPAFSKTKVKQDKAVDTRAERLFRVTLSRNLFPIGFSRNCRSDMGKWELDEQFERPVLGMHADQVNGRNGARVA